MQVRHVNLRERRHNEKKCIALLEYGVQHIYEMCAQSNCNPDRNVQSMQIARMNTPFLI